jgi:hypothetical protein
VNRIEDAGYEVVRRAEGFAEAHETGRGIENGRVGKRAADINADT